MDSYTDFASVYDTFMDETPYAQWADYISQLIAKYGISQPMGKTRTEEKTEENSAQALRSEENLVVELGCGTGTFTEAMAARGYDMIGIDNAPEMLNIASGKRERSGIPIMYLEQDMRELDLYSTAGTFVSVCDSVNYLTEDEDVLQMMKLVNNYLYPQGIFIFDFNTVHKYRDVIGDATIAENREDCSFIWENYYHEKEAVNEYDLTIFRKTENGLFERSVETHYQRGYTLPQMQAFVEKSGMKFITAVDADTHEAVTDDSERIYVIAREQGK